MMFGSMILLYLCSDLNFILISVFLLCSLPTTLCNLLIPPSTQPNDPQNIWLLCIIPCCTLPRSKPISLQSQSSMPPTWIVSKHNNAVLTKQSPIYSKILRDPPKSHEDWIRIMQEQERLHNAEMGKWQSVLQIAVDLLRKVSVVCKKIVKNAKVDELDLLEEYEDEDESLFSVADDLLRQKEL